MEGILHALSDPVRAAIYSDIAACDSSRNCSNFLKVCEKDIPKSTLSQHFKILRDAGLIRSERRGVEMHNTARCAEVDARFPNLLGAILNAHRVQSAGNPRGARARKSVQKLRTTQVPRRT